MTKIEITCPIHIVLDILQCKICGGINANSGEKEKGIYVLGLSHLA